MTLNDLGFGASKLFEDQLLKNPRVRFSEVDDLVTPVQPRSTTPSCFYCSGFDNLTLTPIVFTRSSRSFPTFPSGSNSPYYLCHFVYLGFGSFKILCTRLSRSTSTRNTRSLDACLPVDMTASIRFGSLGFNSYALVAPGVLSPENSDISPPIALDDGRSLFTLGLRHFNKSALLCTQGLSLVHLLLDPTIAGPLQSDPTDWVCSSPLCFLRSLDIDLTVQDPFHNRSDG
jgi:hypothetical protein